VWVWVEMEVEVEAEAEAEGEVAETTDRAVSTLFSNRD
jgi:hypothetical protein